MEMSSKIMKLAAIAVIKFGMESADKEVLNVHTHIEDTIGEITLDFWYDPEEEVNEDVPQMPIEITYVYSWVNGEWQEGRPVEQPF